MRTTSEATKKISEKISQDLDFLVNKFGINEACRKCVTILFSSEAMSDEQDLIEYFFRIVWLFRNCSDSNLLTKKTCVEVTRMAEYALKILNIKPYVSMHSHLYKELYEARSIYFGRTQKPWLASWNLAIADAMDGSETAFRAKNDYKSLICEATYHYDSAFVAESLICYQKADAIARTTPEIIESRLGIIRCLRIYGETGTALEMLNVLTNNYSLSNREKIVLDWEDRFVRAQHAQDMTIILQGIHVASKRRYPDDIAYFVMGHLWSYASRQRALIANLPGSAWIKRHLEIEASDRRTIIALKAVKHLENCYSTKVTIFDKLKETGDVLSEMRELGPLVENTIFFAGVARWLLRVKQKKTASLVIGDYQNLSALLSHGQSNALFNLLDDVGESLNEMSEMTRSPVVQRGVKVGLERTFLYAEILAKIVGVAFSARAKNRQGDAKEASLDSDLLVKISHFFIKYASGAMKGPIHKLGQIILNLVNLPKEAQDNFRSVLWSKTIIHEKSMREVLEAELSASVEEIFLEFNWTPIGVGSVSQVYRARLRSGEEVAVKIQYPQLERIVRQDLIMMNRLLSAARWLFPATDMDRIKLLIQGVCEREIDFNEEIAAFKLLSDICFDGMGWRVPRVYPQVSTRRVLTAEFIDGQNLYQFAEIASDAEKLEIVKAVNEFAILCVVKAGLVVVDPHPANLIISNGLVYLIDFGCCVRVSPEFISFYREILAANILSGDERINAYLFAYRKAGILKESVNVLESDIRELIEVLLLQTNWDQCGKPEVHRRFADLLLKRGLNRIFGSKEPDFVLAYIGQLLIFQTMHKFGASRPPSW